MLDVLQHMLRDPNLFFVAAGTMLIGITAGVAGCFTLLKRQSLIGDGVAHAVLPGVVLAYMLTGDKEPWVLFAGSVVSGWLSLWSMQSIGRHTKLSPDTAVGIVLSVFFGLGVMLLGVVQAEQSGNQSGLDKFLFGQAASLLPADVIFLSAVCVLVLVTVGLAYKELQLRSFDPEFARSLGYDHGLVRHLETAMLVVVLTTGLQAVGVILMAAVLIIPAATARYWTDRLRPMLMLSAGFGALAGLVGSVISYSAPAMPTGPWMVVSSALILLLSMLAAPKYGYLSQRWSRRRQSRRIDEENLVKTLWLLREEHGAENAFNRAQILDRRPTNTVRMDAAVGRLADRGWIRRDAETDAWRLTKPGRDEARRLVRIHRLWETYLTELLQIADDHVHDDADSMEHLITPEIEEQLAARLGYPTEDPHRKSIPYGKGDGKDDR